MHYCQPFLSDTPGNSFCLQMCCYKMWKNGFGIHAKCSSPQKKAKCFSENWGDWWECSYKSISNIFTIFFPHNNERKVSKNHNILKWVVGSIKWAISYYFIRSLTLILTKLVCLYQTGVNLQQSSIIPSRNRKLPFSRWWKEIFLYILPSNNLMSSFIFPRSS